jgi:hypothetical protein
MTSHPPSPSPSRRRAALVVAHPGHELRVHGFCERARPLVCVLTDGSGAASRPRLAETTALLARLGAVPGPIYGRLTDRELYAALLAGDHERLAALAAELAAVLAVARIEVVAGDAAEGWNPGHDLCRLLVNAALARLAADGHRPIENLEFPLHAAPDAAPEPAGPAAAPDGCRLVLDDAALARKLAAARAYSGLESEVARALDRHGPEAFRVERLRPVDYGLDLAPRLPEPPLYERYGEERVAAGRYAEVIRFRRHLAPAAERLRAFADGA